MYVVLVPIVFQVMLGEDLLSRRIGEWGVRFSCLYAEKILSCVREANNTRVKAYLLSDSKAAISFSHLDY